MAGQSANLERRFDLDWIRIAAFGLLILYHVGMVFVPWSYHVKSDHQIAGLEPIMRALNPWRLSLLFVVAGAATSFMATKSPPGALAAQRTRRLLVPLLFGMLVVVPPQAFWEVVSRHLYADDFATFYTQRYFAFAKEFCGNGPCLILPTWNHLWFVAYLLLYTLITMLLAAVIPRVVNGVEAVLARSLCGVGVLVLPAALFALYRLSLFPRFPQTNALFGDWYNHALYFSMFALGYLIARSEPVWSAMMRWRRVAVVTSIVLYASYLLARAYWPLGAVTATWPSYAHALYGVYQWTCIVAALGFGRRWITGDSAARRYLTDAIFAYYIVHQTAILGTAFTLRDRGLPVSVEAATIIMVTAASCVLTYEVVRRVSWLRPLFGLKRLAPA